MFDRRYFLKRAGLVSLAPMVPVFLDRWAFASQSKSTSGRILVVIQLDGGNDGINTVVPYKDEGYHKFRRELRLPEADLIKLTDEFALNSRLRSVSQLFDAGLLSFVHGVGYPNPNRSHFESMAIWHVGSTDPDLRSIGRGWLGEALSTQPNSTNGQQAIHVGDEALPVAIRGRRCTTSAISNANDLRLRSDLSGHIEGSNRLAPANGSLEADKVSIVDFVSKTVSQAYASAAELSHFTAQDASARYPDTPLATRLKLVSQFIKSDAAARVYYTLQPGYDTHAGQLGTHGELLGELSSALKAFMDDLKQSGLEERVLVMAFSEFGRRVEENDSLGTDHGTAGPVLLAGAKLAARNYGQMPSLTDLDGGDLKYHMDFRHVYGSILTDWLGLERPAPLQGYQIPGMFSAS